MLILESFSSCISIFPGNRMKRKTENSTAFNCTGVANQLQMQKHNTAI